MIYCFSLTKKEYLIKSQKYDKLIEHAMTTPMDKHVRFRELIYNKS